MKRISSLFGKLTLGVAIMFCLPTMGFAQSRYLDNIKAAERGDADAQCVIGDCYKAGDGVEQSNAYAVKWYRKAAEQGNAEACYQLGMSYYKAEGVFQDFVEARHWLQKSDFSKHNDAALMLASFFRTGTGGPADSAMAAKYQQIAAENGDAASLYSLAVQYYNGTGKEHIAHLLHDKSKRAGKPFVAVDCGSLSKELAPSAFFGHVKGAFTGADNAKKGYFHEAEGGTLFLDEVGNLALETQQMLLRAIQERRYRPVGDKADRNFNVRIIAATNEDLEVSVNEKRFRQDLLYRLHDFGITVPPLRDCQEDIMPLAEFFRDMTHAWPGNVRELRQKVMGAVLQAQEGVVMKEHLELAVTKPTSTVSFALRNDAEDKERILRALKQANGNRSVAAELLGIGRTTLYSKLEEYGLKYKFKQS